MNYLKKTILYHFFKVFIYLIHHISYHSIIIKMAMNYYFSFIAWVSILYISLFSIYIKFVLF